MASTMPSLFMANCASAFETVRNVVREEKIDCGFAMQGRYIMAASPGQRESLNREFDLRAKHLGDSYTPVSRADQHRARSPPTSIMAASSSPTWRGCIPASTTRAFSIARWRPALRILPFTPVQAFRREADGFEIFTPRGRLVAKDVILATNGYSGPAFPWLQRRVVPFDAYMIATEPLPPSVLDAVMPGKRTFIDWNFDVDFIRRSPDDSRILFGGNTGVIGADLTRMAGALRQKLRRVLPQLGDVTLAHCWTGRCAGTRDLYPHIGVEEGVHYAVGYCFAGVPMGTHFGLKLARRLLGRGDAQSVFWQRPFEAIPLYRGNPWFVPYAMRWYARHDWR